MKTCVFLGQRDCPASIRTLMVNQIENLIENKNVDLFYMGYKGQFNDIARNVMRDMAIVYPEIHYSVAVS